jgi:hypothetical protein
MGWFNLFTRGLPLRIVMIGTLTGLQWGIYDACAWRPCLVPLFPAALLCCFAGAACLVANSLLPCSSLTAPMLVSASSLTHSSMFLAFPRYRLLAVKVYVGLPTTGSAAPPEVVALPPSVGELAQK